MHKFNELSQKEINIVTGGLSLAETYGAIKSGLNQVVEFGKKEIVNSFEGVTLGEVCNGAGLVLGAAIGLYLGMDYDTSTKTFVIVAAAIAGGKNGQLIGDAIGSVI